MTQRKSASIEQKLAQAATTKAAERYVLRLYVTGATPQSRLAILNVKKVCEERLQGRYDLEVIDICQKPAWPRTNRSWPPPRSSRSCRLPCAG